MSHRHDGDGHVSARRFKELEREVMLLRFHNLRLLDQLEKTHPPDGVDAVVYIQVKQPGEHHA